MRTGFYFMLLGCSLMLQPAAAGDQLTIPGHVPSSHQQVLPKRGISMDDVLSQFGEPDERYGPIGDPPITEWVYGSFRVYFEYQIVLHTIDMTTLIMPSRTAQ